MTMADGNVEKQGHLGDLIQKPMAHLKELLERQEKLLLNKRFISSLSDKGKKISDLADRLRKTIEEKEKLDTTSSLFQKMRLSPDEETEGTHLLYRQIINRPKAKEEIDERLEPKAEKLGNTGSTLKTVDAEISSGPSPSFLSDSGPRRKNNENTRHISCEISSSDVNMDSMNKVEKMEVPGEMRDDIKTKKPKAHFRYDSVLYPPKSKYEKAKTLSVEDSCKLQEEQNKRLQEIQAQQIAARLSQRLNIQPEAYTYQPEGMPGLFHDSKNMATDMPAVPEDSDEEVDYPD